MRILLVIDGMHPREGGPPVVVAGLAKALRKCGHELAILTLADPADEAVIRDIWSEMIEGGVELHCRHVEAFEALRGFPGDKALFRSLVDSVDVVHLHSLWSLFAIQIGRIAREQHRPYFISTHGVFDHRAMTRIKRKWLKKRLAVPLLGMRKFLNGAAGVVFGSKAEAEYSWLPSPDMKLRFVPNGVDAINPPPPSEMQKNQLLAAAPATAHWKRLILCRSRIHEEKGHDMLVSAFDSVADDFPDTGLLIAGMKQDERYEDKVRALITSSAHKDRIVLTTSLTGPSSAFLYQVCDGYVAPSIAEGFSMSVVETLAHGRPQLITRYCHMPEVETVGAGIIVEPTVPAIAAGLRTFLSMSGAEWQDMGKAAKALFAEKFTWDRVADVQENLYRQAVAGGSQ